MIPRLTRGGQLRGLVARVDVIDNGQSLQILLEAGRTSPVSFSYTIDDGQGGSDTASVVVSMRARKPLNVCSRSSSPPDRTCRLCLAARCDQPPGGQKQRRHQPSAEQKRPRGAKRLKDQSA